MRISKIVVLVGCLFVFGSSVVSASGTMDELLYNAVANNNVELAQTAIAGGASVNGVKGDGHTTPLVLAVRHNSTVMVEYLLAHGADPNQMVKDDYPYSKPPLVIAVDNGNLPIAKMLVQAGANVNASNEKKKGREVLDLYPTLTDGASPLLFALQYDIGAIPFPMVQFLISKGADVNQANDYGLTPLMAVARSRGSAYTNEHEERCQVAKMLLAAGADPAKKDGQGRTALQYAISANFTDMINLLLPISPK